MSDCSVGDYSVSCPGACRLICTSTHCYGWCEPVYVGEVDEDLVTVQPTVIEVRRGPDVTPGTRPEGPDSVTLCAHGLSREGLIAGLGTALGARLESTVEDADEEEREMPFSGTLDEALDYLGLRRGTADSRY